VPEPTSVSPLQTNDRLPVLVGSAVWVVLLVLALMMREELTQTGRGWWAWTCAAGLALGLAGLAYLQARQSRSHPR